MLANINTNINMADREDVRAVEDRFGSVIHTIFVWGIIIFPWIVVPNFSQNLELPREIFLFVFSGLFSVLYFLYSLKKRQLEWRRTKIDWLLGLWVVVLGLIFFYSNNFKISWEGFPGSMTGGLSEYLAFITFYLISTQLFSELAWKSVMQYFLVSLMAVLVFFIVITVYFQSNSILTLDFARTPSLVTAAGGVIALAFWWVLKRNETVKKGHLLAVVLVVFFVSSLLDFHSGSHPRPSVPARRKAVVQWARMPRDRNSRTYTWGRLLLFSRRKSLVFRRHLVPGNHREFIICHRAPR